MNWARKFYSIPRTTRLTGQIFPLTSLKPILLAEWSALQALREQGAELLRLFRRDLAEHAAPLGRDVVSDG